MAGAFKTVATKNITRHTAHKSYEVVLLGHSGSFSAESDLEVFVYHGKDNTAEYGLSDTATTNGYNNRDIWNSINTNFYKKVEGPPGEGGGYQGHVDPTFKGSTRILSNPLGEHIRVMSIPHLMIGDGIKPGSFQHVSSVALKFHDDGLGNVYQTLGGTTTKVGNIFYEHGIIVVEVASANIEYFTAGTLSFKNTHVIEEHEYMCNAGKHEFNATTNQSVLSNIASGSVAGFVSSSAFNPYVTTVGLYDDNSNLLAIGKLGQAIKKSEKFDTSYVVRFDT